MTEVVEREMEVAGLRTSYREARDDDGPNISINNVSVLEGKQMSDTTVPGTLLRASTSAATLRVPRPLSAFANLRLRLQGADGAVRPGDLYAKVVSGEPDADGGLLVRFTSADPEVMDALRQALAGSAK